MSVMSKILRVFKGFFYKQQSSSEEEKWSIPGGASKVIMYHCKSTMGYTFTDHGVIPINPRAWRIIDNKGLRETLVGAEIVEKQLSGNESSLNIALSGFMMFSRNTSFAKIDEVKGNYYIRYVFGGKPIELYSPKEVNVIDKSTVEILLSDFSKVTLIDPDLSLYCRQLRLDETDVPMESYFTLDKLIGPVSDK